MIYSAINTKSGAFKPYRVYMQEDGVCRVHRTYKSMAAAMKSAAKVSMEATYAEVHDDSRTMRKRLVAVFKNGALKGTVGI